MSSMGPWFTKVIYFINMIISGKLKFTWIATLKIARCQWDEGFSINIIPIHARSGACTSCHVSLKVSLLIKSFKAILNLCEIIIFNFFLKQRTHVHLSYLIWHSTCSGSMHKCKCMELSLIKTSSEFTGLGYHITSH